MRYRQSVSASAYVIVLRANRDVLALSLQSGAASINGCDIINPQTVVLHVLSEK